MPVGALQQVAGLIVDIHGQGENLSLLRSKLQLEFLDRFAGLDEVRQQVTHAYRASSAVQTEMRHLQRDSRELAQRSDLLIFQIQEIAEASLSPGEEDALRGEYRRAASQCGACGSLRSDSRSAQRCRRTRAALQAIGWERP